MELPFFSTTASSSTTSQGEALRWLAIAEKLLHGRDLVGSKSFASRAREADPTLLYADQIIAVTDTLVAGDKRINNNLPDWYSILQIGGGQTRDAELINSQYRKLTFLLNPQKNRLPYADQAFNLVLNAWSVLSNSSSKTLYDNELMAAAHSSGGIPPSSGFNNPIFSGVTREQQQQMNYQPFEINFQVMPQQQQQQQQQQGGVREQVSQMLPLHSMNRERLNQQFPPQNVNLEQVGHPFPQLHLSRDQSQQQQQQPQLHPHQQQQPQGRPEPQLHQLREENWMGGNAADVFGGGSGVQNLNVNATDLGGNPNNAFENAQGRDDDRNKGSSDDPNLNFWTACPYCYYMYEYPKEYAECVLLCQNKKCRKAFQGVVIPKPPSTVEGKDGKDAYFCCWGIMPMGISMTTLDRHRGYGGNWTPFSPMFSLKGSGNITNAGNANLFGSRNVNDDTRGSRGGGNTGGNNPPGPRVYVDDDDVFLEYSDSGGESDTDWQRNGGKRAKGGRRRVATATPTTNVQKAHIDKSNIVNAHDNGDVSDGFVPQDSTRISAVSVTESVKKGITDARKKGVSESITKGALAISRRQSARVAKNFGSLDLNVEFSNESEEPRRRVIHYNGPGRGEEDIIEGGAFFEGLDEFLSSLPISMSEG